ncbi:tenascin isoform X1 [Kryptolebias marmoratus]|uniref:tenascin isoform X1 n=1 Tax=Kryptolebias marmoratus TaxID=37003 RepID=UPI0007F8679B|nr:tenascin isoform X1 [Kryptolebias marmoratus]XP_037831751.1 tenascin isoform X1 [Kryptolebias marmoratus]XP_037831752.1 tenascin isoform X1 [Kryptolebias marmoratus]
MLPLTSSLIVLLLAGSALLTPETSTELQAGGERRPRDAEQDSIKVVISEGCTSQGDSSNASQEGKEINLDPGSPLVLTHRIKLVPSGQGSGLCGCEADFAALRERLESLEREVSDLREKCGGAEGSCCTSESKGAGCSIKSELKGCPSECSDQGRCVDGKCVCFAGYSGPDCSESSCPGNCNNNGRCVNGQCVCDPGFSDLNCSQRVCPDNCNDQGKCVNGKCVCDSGFTGPSCSEESCPGNCNRRGRCVKGQCVCNPGFTGSDCSKKACPDNCNNRGRCVNGKCVCSSGFTGADCSETACPRNCNNRGRCINGKCVCNNGFTGADCSERDCPNNCSNRGKCVNGKCVCKRGFTGADCSEIACPRNCNNRGRCINGQCVCNDGFTGTDCSKKACLNNCSNQGRCVGGKCVCDSGFTSADCSEIACPGNCNNRGRCINGQCVCNVGFTGADCLEKACPNNCNQGGSCVDGKCVCNSGFSGADCSEIACPENCNNRGRCINGHCSCDDGFTGADCSEKACPNNCNNQGRCVDGKCVCDSGFTSEDCSEIACPGNCNNRGHCINGQCVCNDGFTGADCSEKACPNSCNNQGRCVNGKCVCNVGFTGPDCAAKGCPNNCNKKGVCLKGKCVCRGGFTGSDCSQCKEGKTGPKCNLAMTGVSLTSQDITESSVTLIWTKPFLQYETYYITFTSLKESSEQITVQVDGSLTTFTQTGLAVGQGYSVKIVGEIEGRKGAESTTEFTTLISAPTNLHVVKTTSSSAVVQWEASQGEVDRYRLTFLPSDGAGTSQEMIISAGQTSAHIHQLEAGRLYKIFLVAEKGLIRSQPVSTQVVPGSTLSRVTTEDLNTQVTQAPGHDVGSKDQKLNLSPGGQVVDQQGVRNRDSANVEDSSAGIIAKTKPLMARNGTGPRVVGRPVLSKSKVPGFFRFNATSGRRRLVPGSIHKKPVVAEKGKVMEINNPQPDVLTIRDSGKDQSEEASSSEKSEHIRPAVMPGSDSETNRQRSSEEPTSAIGSKRQPDVGIAIPGNDTDLVSLNTTGTIQSQEKKCLNKIKVTHFRLPLKDRSNTYRGNGTGLQGNTLGSNSNETPPHKEADLDYTQDSLQKLIRNTYNNLNITTISVHLFKPLNLSTDADIVRTQILKGVEQFSGLSSELSSSDDDAAEPPSSLKYLISSSPSPLVPHSSSSPSSLPLLSPSSSSSSSNEFDSHDSTELNSSTDSPLTEDRKLSRSDKHTRPLFLQTLPKRGSIRRVYPNFELLRNKTNQNLRIPDHPPSHLSHTPKQEAEVNLPMKDVSSDKDAKTTLVSSGVEHGQTNRARGKIPVRRPYLKGSYPRRLFSNVRNQTRSNLRYFTQPSKPSNSNFTQPSQPSNPKRDTQKEHLFPTELPATSPSVSGAGPVSGGNEGKVGTRLYTASSSTELDQTTIRRGVPFFRRPNFRRPLLRGKSFQNETFTNLRQHQYPYRGFVRKPFLTRKQNVGNFTAGSQTNQLGKVNNPENPEIQSQHRNVHRSFHSSLTNKSREEENVHLSQIALTDGHEPTASKETKESEKGGNALIELEAITDSANHKVRLNAGRNIGAANLGSPSIKNTFRPLRPVTVLNRQSLSRTIMAKHHDTHSNSDTQNKEHLKANQTAKSIYDSEQTADIESDVSSSDVTREPLDFVGVTNRTSSGYTLVWDSPEGKYKNFLVSRTEVKQDEGLQQKESTQKEDKDQNIKDSVSENGGHKDDNRVPESFGPQVPNTQDGTVAKSTGSNKVFKKVLPGSARSLQFEHLPPQTEYTLTLLGGGPGLLSRLHKLVISTGPEPPSNIVFSKVTENSLTVSWTKPRSSVSGFKVTYTQSDDEEPVSVSVDSEDSTVNLSQLSPGLSYEVTIISTLGLDESDPVKDFVTTLPDPPSDLQALNVTDTTALLLWRPALAAVDKYAIVYGSESGSGLRITVSGNTAEQRLSGLEESTTYTVTITSQLGGQESSSATTSFTTSSSSAGDFDEARDLQAKNVTPRTADVSWTPPIKPVDRYILSYQTEGEKSEEIIVGPNETQYKLTRLHPGSLYDVNLRSLRGAQLSANTFTKFTTGKLQFPFPTDCSQELLNGVLTSDTMEIFPHGKLGKSMMVYCDMETDGGGWTVFQRRKDGSEDFYRNFNDYVEGFGNLNGEFWLGLEKLHNLTTMTRMNLRVDLRDEGEQVFAQYSTFQVAKRNYKLTVGGYSGTAGDSLTYHNDCAFTAKDRSPLLGLFRCAISYQGGWWYNNCHEANLNGLYGNNYKHQGVIWKSWKGEHHSIQFTEMKLRPANFRTPSRGL